MKAIVAIYNEAIRETVATFDTEEKTVADQKQWFHAHGRKNPMLVAEKDDHIVGWAALSPWSDRCAYAETAEVSLYVKKEYQRQGIGRQLLERVLDAGEHAGLHVVLARITEGNQNSIRLHESLGFEQVGVMSEVGYKFGRRLDVFLMQKVYDR